MSINRYIRTRPLWVDVDVLVDNLTEKSKRLDGYDRLGIVFEAGLVDVSHMMYLDVLIGKGSSNISVLADSYEPENSKMVEALLDLIVHYSQQGNSNTTIYGKVKNVFMFAAWAREVEKLPVRNIEEARVAYEQYTLDLKSRMRIQGKSQISGSTAHSYQGSAKEILEYMFNDDKNHYISSYVPVIPSTSRGSATTVDDEDVTYALNFYYHFFNQTADFIFEGKLYPFKMNLPNEPLWIFPYKPIAYPSTRDHTSHIRAYDFKNGRIASEEEVVRLAGSKNKSAALKNRKGHIEALNEANRDITSNIHRVSLAGKGVLAYYMVLLLLTGMNDKVLATMLWNGEFDEESGKQGFKTIKPRAKNKNVRFEIQNEFLGSFRKFLKLREYALQGQQFDYLFFLLSSKNKPVLNKRNRLGNLGSKIFWGTFSSLDPNLPPVLSRKFRVHKTKWVYKENGLWATTVMAQSSPSVVLSRYHGKSEEEKVEELNDFMNKMHLGILENKKDRYLDTSVGGCEDYGSPRQEIENKNFKSDCSRPEGCLFCEKYKAHPDEKDLRKLYSLEYVIREVSAINAQSLEHFEGVMGPVLDRIDIIVAAIKKKNKQMIKAGEDIKKDVFENENLHPYWEMKIKTLYAMGVVR